MAPHASQRPVPRSSPMVSCFAYARTRSISSASDDPVLNESTHSFNQHEGYFGAISLAVGLPEKPPNALESAFQMGLYVVWFATFDPLIMSE